MNRLYTCAPKWRLGWSLGLLAWMSQGTPGWTQTPTQTSQQQERAACFSQADTTDLSSCLMDTRNAHADMKKGLTPDVPLHTLEANRLKRCAVHHAEDLLDCEARVKGDGTHSGSVQGGGVLTEYRRTMPTP